jgi:ABC-type amino acid transport system permease subunit
MYSFATVVYFVMSFAASRAVRRMQARIAIPR